MSASKKYKSSETATEIIHQQDTENINSNRFRKSADYFGPSTSAAAAAAAAAAQTNQSGVGGRIALGQQNINNTNPNAMQRSGSNTNLNSNYTHSAGSGVGNGNGGGAGIGTNGERRANFSMLETTGHMNDHRSSTTTSAFFNKMGTNNASKPGDVKKIVIKNFKGKYTNIFSFSKYKNI